MNLQRIRLCSMISVGFEGFFDGAWDRDNVGSKASHAFKFNLGGVGLRDVDGRGYTQTCRRVSDR